MRTNYSNKLFCLLTCLVCALPAMAYSFAANGIYYNITSSTDKTVEVTSGDNKYTGDVTIPSSVINSGTTYAVTAIGNNAFESCTNLKSVDIPNSVKTIGDGAFKECVSLKSVDIPNSVKTIGDKAFDNCTALTTLEIPNSVTSIGEFTFWCCSKLESIVIPNSVKTIGLGAFQQCSSLTSIEIPNSITTISDYLFQLCTKLASVKIPTSVTSIGEFAFRNCSALKSITIPASVTSIGANTFFFCSALTSVTNLSTTPQTINSSVFSGVDLSKATLYVPNGSLNKYKAADVWKDFSSISEGTSGIEAVEGEAMTASASNGEIVITGIGEAAPVSVCTTSGVQVYAGTSKSIAVAPGLYIVKVAGKAVKVIVKK